MARTDTHTRPLGRRAERGRAKAGRLPPAAEWHAAWPSVCRSAALPAPFVLRSYRVPRPCVCSPHGAVLTSRSCTEPEWPSRASPARPSSAPASFQTRCTLPHCRPRTNRCTDRPRRRFECIPFVALFNVARLGVCRTRKATGTLGWASGKRGLRCWGCGGRRRRRVCVHACRTARRSRRTSRSRPPAASRLAERRATGRSVRIGAVGHVVTARSAAMRPAPIAANCRERARVVSPMCGPIQLIGAQAWHVNNGVAAARGCRAPLGPSPPLGLREVRAEVRECLQSYTVRMPTPGSRAEGKKAWIKSRSVQSRSARARAGMGKLKRAVVANTSSIVMVVLPNTLSGLT